jgi:hypothetical protein
MLRIAWSVAWGVLCLLLIALCVRSYSWEDRFVMPLSDSKEFVCESTSGRLQVDWSFTPFGIGPPGAWYVQNNDMADMVEGREYQGVGIWGFGIKHFEEGTNANIPHWFAAVMCCGIATCSWFRFSLRTLLLATTLVGVVLGLIVWAMK